MKFIKNDIGVILGIIFIVLPISMAQIFQQLLPLPLTTPNNFDSFDNFHSDLGLNKNTETECEDSLPQLQFGKLSPLGGNSIGSRRSIICNAGFDIIGEHKRYAICTPAGRWHIDSDCTRVDNYSALSQLTTKATVTEEKYCKFIFILNGKLLPGDSSIGSRRTVQCNPGYEPDPQDTPFAYCRASQLWDVLTTCILRQASTPTTAVVTTKTTTPSETPTTTTQEGHNLSGGAIAGIVLGVVVGIALAITIGLLCKPYCDDLNGNL